MLAEPWHLGTNGKARADRLGVRGDVLRRAHARRARRPLRPAPDVPRSTWRSYSVLHPGRGGRAERRMADRAAVRRRARAGGGADPRRHLPERAAAATRPRALPRLGVHGRLPRRAARGVRRRALRGRRGPADRRLALAADRRRARAPRSCGRCAATCRSRRAGTRSAATTRRRTRPSSAMEDAARAGAAASATLPEPEPDAGGPQRRAARRWREIFAARVPAPLDDAVRSSRSCRRSATTASGRWRRSCSPRRASTSSRRSAIAAADLPRLSRRLGGVDRDRRAASSASC